MNLMQQAIAWTLVHFCWQAAAIALVYRFAAWAVARRSSPARYLVSLCALLAMLFAASATFAWELHVGPAPAPYVVSGSAGQPVAPHPALAPIASAVFSQSPGSTQQSTPLLSLIPTGILSWIDGLWVFGVVALSLRSLGGWWIIQRLRTSATQHAPAIVLASFHRISSALGLRRPVFLRISASIAGPMTVGALRAIVLLPLSTVTSLGPDELEVVLAHELAHVRRADFFWNLLQTLTETLFFFHPAVWWISSRIRHERELCCDDLALQVCPNPIVYARALCRLEEQRSRALHLALALNGHQSPQTLHMRICRILGEPMTYPKYQPARPLSLTAACLALIVLVLPMPRLLAGTNPPTQAPAPAVAATRLPATSASQPVVAVDVSTIVRALPHPTVQVNLAHRTADSAPVLASLFQAGDQKAASTASHGDYIDQMKAAGYDVELDKYLAMKIQNVTPEYARSMASAGFGKPSADELIACRMQQITPEYIAQLKQQGFEVNNLQDAISYHMFQVTPEFVAGMKAAGFDGLTAKQLLAMRVQGITPDYARETKKRFPGATADDLIKTRIFRIDSAFIAEAEKHGFKNLSLDKLVQLRISGLFDDESVKP